MNIWMNEKMQYVSNEYMFFGERKSDSANQGEKISKRKG